MVYELGVGVTVNSGTGEKRVVVVSLIPQAAMDGSDIIDVVPHVDCLGLPTPKEVKDNEKEDPCGCGG